MHVKNLGIIPTVQLAHKYARIYARFYASCIQAEELCVRIIWFLKFNL
jgi:hypothetical protein